MAPDSPLKKARLERGMSLRAVAAEVGVSYAAVSNWEKGKNTPLGDSLLRLAKLYDCRPEDLLCVA